MPVLNRPARATLWAPDRRLPAEDEADAFQRVYHLVCWQHGKRFQKVYAAGGQVLEDAGQIVGVLADYLDNEGHEDAAQKLRELRTAFQTGGELELPLGGEEPSPETVAAKTMRDDLDLTPPAKGAETP